MIYSQKEMITHLFIEVMQRIVENCQDQNGSRMIQQHFETASSEDRDLIFEKVLPESLKLAKNVFGNYVIQKILEKGTKEQKHELFKTFEGEIYNLTIDVYGCRVIQKALEVNHSLIRKASYHVFLITLGIQK